MRMRAQIIPKDFPRLEVQPQIPFPAGFSRFSLEKRLPAEGTQSMEMGSTSSCFQLFPKPFSKRTNGGRKRHSQGWRGSGMGSVFSMEKRIYSLLTSGLGFGWISFRPAQFLGFGADFWLPRRPQKFQFFVASQEFLGCSSQSRRRMEAEKTFPEHSRIPVPGMSEEAQTGGFGVPLPGSGCIFWDLGCGIPSGIPNLDVYTSHSSDPSGPLGTHPKEFFFLGSAGSSFSSSLFSRQLPFHPKEFNSLHPRRMGISLAPSGSWGFPNVEFHWKSSASRSLLPSVTPKDLQPGFPAFLWNIPSRQSSGDTIGSRELLGAGITRAEQGIPGKSLVSLFSSMPQAESQGIPEFRDGLVGRHHKLIQFQPQHNPTIPGCSELSPWTLPDIPAPPHPPREEFLPNIPKSHLSLPLFHVQRDGRIILGFFHHS